MKQETPPTSVPKPRRPVNVAPADASGATGPSPLDILLAVMRRRWDAEDEAGAVQIALAAAPFLHPRRARPHAHPGADDAAERTPDQMTDAELARLIADTGTGPNRSGGDP